MPGPWSPTLLIMPGAGLVDPGGGIAGPRIDRQRLDHHRAELGRGGSRPRARRRGRRCPTPSSPGWAGLERPDRDRQVDVAGGHRPPGPPHGPAPDAARSRPGRRRSAHRLTAAWYSWRDRTDSGWRSSRRCRPPRPWPRPPWSGTGTRWARAVARMWSTVGPGAAAPRRVDHQLDLAPGDQVDGVDHCRVRSSPTLATTVATAMPSASSSAAVPEVAARSKPRAAKCAGRLQAGRLVPVGQREEDRPASREPVAGGDLALGEGQPEGGVDAHDLAGRAHLGPEQGVDPGEPVERAGPPP